MLGENTVKPISQKFCIKFFDMFKKANGSGISKIAIKYRFLRYRKDSFFFSLFGYAV